MDIDRWCQGIGVVILGLLYALQGSTVGAILIAAGETSFRRRYVVMSFRRILGRFAALSVLHVDLPYLKTARRDFRSISIPKGRGAFALNLLYRHGTASSVQLNR